MQHALVDLRRNVPYVVSNVLLNPQLARFCEQEVADGNSPLDIKQ